MGRMHVQRAIQGAANPKVLLATDISPARLKDLEDSFSGLAKKRHIDLVVKTPPTMPKISSSSSSRWSIRVVSTTSP